MRTFSMPRLTMVLITLLSGPMLPAWGEEASPSYPYQAPALYHHLSLRFVWVDSLRRPLRPAALPGGPGNHSLLPTETSEEPPQGPRSLGLSYLRWQIYGQWSDHSSLQLGLRPDASLRRGPSGSDHRPLDTRAGKVYKEASPIELLDSYHLSLYPQADRQAVLALGVWEQLAPLELAYEPLLAFGLGVHLPEKVQGIKASWRFSPSLLSLSQGERGEAGSMELWLYQGRQDRVEKFGYKAKSFDEAPVAFDPYLGGAWRIRGALRPQLEGALLLGFEERSKEQARKRETYGEACLHHRFEIWQMPLLSAWNLRYSRESWQATAHAHEPLVQLSLAGTSQLLIKPRQAVLVGLHIGRSERHLSPQESEKKILYFGHQWDLGWQYVLSAGLHSQLFVSEEHRQKINDDNELEAGFQREGARQKMLRRLGLALHYQISEGR